MIERLLENWLDNASERSYQSVFVQMLVAAGYRVLHSTRHCLLEYGKDIIAIDPAGIGCAFQLKGDPKGRLKISTFRSEIQAQLVQLTSQVPPYPGFPAGIHRSILVTNGLVEEEVQVAIAQMNAGPFPSKVEVWSRGDLLKMALQGGAALWPSELTATRSLLEIYLADPRENLDISKLSLIILGLFNVDDSVEMEIKASEFRRMVSAAALVTGICLSPYAEAENHLSVISGWTLFTVSVIGLSEKHGHSVKGDIESSLQLGELEVLDALTALCEESLESRFWTEGDVLTDPEVFGWRVGLLYGLLSILILKADEGRLLDPLALSRTKDLLRISYFKFDFWGEGAIAHLLPWILFLRKFDPSLKADFLIRELLEQLLRSNKPRSNSGLSSTYVGFDEVLRSRTGVYERSSDLGSDETYVGSAFTSELLMHLAARTKSKSVCRANWPDFTRVAVRRFEMERMWHFCLLKAPGGVETTNLYPFTYRWSQLRHDALNAGTKSNVPTELKSRPWLLMLWCLICPHRLDSSTGATIVESVLPGWGS